jgi:hypothetical protein
MNPRAFGSQAPMPGWNAPAATENRLDPMKK